MDVYDSRPAVDPLINRMGRFTHMRVLRFFFADIACCQIEALRHRFKMMSGRGPTTNCLHQFAQHTVMDRREVGRAVGKLQQTEGMHLPPSAALVESGE